MNDKARAAVVAAIVIGLIAATAYYLYQRQDANGSNTAASPTPEVNVDALPFEETANVEIVNGQFSPDNLTVKAGTTVTWTNRDAEWRDVQAEGAGTSGPSSPSIGEDESFSFIFTDPGTYTYFSSTDMDVKAQIVVAGE